MAFRNKCGESGQIGPGSSPDGRDLAERARDAGQIREQELEIIATAWRRIVTRLAAGEARVVDLTAELGLAQSTVSKHLACLRGCGLVDYRTEGRQSFYALTRPELMDLLQAADGVLTAAGRPTPGLPSGITPQAAVA